jgi:hypothetical protein
VLSLRASLPQLISGIAGLAWALILLPAWRLTTSTADLLGRSPGDFESALSSMYAAVRDPIDWARPFAVSNLDAPTGTTIFLNDIIPAAVLPMRLLHQLLRVTLDPQIVLTLLSVVFFALGCASVARLAATLGATPLAALCSGLLPLLAMPWVAYIPNGIAALSGWFVIVLAIDTLIRIARGSRGRGVFIQLFLLLNFALWLNPYYALNVLVLTGFALLHALFRGEIRIGAGLLAPILVALAPLMIFGASGPESSQRLLSFGGSGDWGLGAGLLGVGFLDPDQGLYTSYIRYWGLAFTLLALAALSRILRLGAVGVGALLLGLYATGSPAAGGFVPEIVYQTLPFNSWASIDRFFAPLMILAMAIGPSLAAGWISAARSRLGGLLRTLPALGLVSLLIAEIVFAIVAPNGGLAATRRGAPEALRPRLVAIERLMASHPLVAISPDVSCYNRYFDMGDDNDSPAGAALNNTARFVSRAILAVADGGGSLNTSLSSRRPVCPYQQYEQALPPDTLAILFRSALVDMYPNDPGIFARPLPATYLCAEGDGTLLFSPIGGGEEESPSLTIRVCSERREEIIALAKEIDAQLTGGDDPWGVASEIR